MTSSDATPRSSRSIHGYTLEGYSTDAATATRSPGRQSSPAASSDSPCEVLRTKATSSGAHPIRRAKRSRQSVASDSQSSKLGRPTRAVESMKAWTASTTRVEVGTRPRG